MISKILIINLLLKNHQYIARDVNTRYISAVVY